MSKPDLNDCFLHDKDRLKHHEALDILKRQIEARVGTEKVALKDALGRVIAEEIRAAQDVPLTDNAAVDGYAFASSGHEQCGGFFPVVARIAAGELNPVALPAEGAARIFTGAPMPAGADSVAMQEDCETHEQDGAQFVIIPQGLKPGANRRRAGEDTQKNDLIFSPGRRLTPEDIAGLASNGVGEVSVYQKVRIAIISTGDELIPPGEEIKPGQVYNSNGPLLEALLANLPVEITNHGAMPDDFEQISAALKDLSSNHDVIITTGGASRGEEDHVISALETHGTRHLWQMAIKPGRPMSFGTLGDALFIGLPGNPVAAFVCFILYARQIILRFGGAEWIEPPRFPLPAAFEIPKKKTDRREFQRGILREIDGVLHVDKFRRDGSGLITGLREADGLIEIPEDVNAVERGSTVSFIPFSALGISS